MDADKPTPDGLLDGLRRMADSLLGLVQTRVELISVELQEEKLRSLRLLIWLAAAFALGLGGVLILLAALSIYSWNVAGYAGLIVLGLVVLGVATLVILRVRNALLSGPAPFAETAAQFRKDRECLRNND